MTGRWIPTAPASNLLTTPHLSCGQCVPTHVVSQDNVPQIRVIQVPQHETSYPTGFATNLDYAMSRWRDPVFWIRCSGCVIWQLGCQLTWCVVRCYPCAGSCGQWRGSRHLLLWLSTQWVGGHCCIPGNSDFESQQLVFGGWIDRKLER